MTTTQLLHKMIADVAAQLDTLHALRRDASCPAVANIYAAQENMLLNIRAQLVRDAAVSFTREM
jgi:hypothetical protein